MHSEIYFKYFHKLTMKNLQKTIKWWTFRRMSEDKIVPYTVKDIHIHTQYPRGISFPQMWIFWSTLSLPSVTDLSLLTDHVTDGYKSSKFISTSALPLRHLSSGIQLQEWRKQQIEKSSIFQMKNKWGG